MRPRRRSASRAVSGEAAHGIETSSPVNLCVSTGRAVVATRVSFDYGWYPPDDDMLSNPISRFVKLCGYDVLGGSTPISEGHWDII